MRRRSRWLLLSTAFAALMIATAWWVIQRPVVSDWASAPPALQGVMWPVARPVADFELRDQHGQRFDAKRLRGHWSLLYFGYLQCPDVCPTTLQSLHALSELIARSGAEATLPQVVFITVDPEHDSAQRLASYLSYFDERFIGLTGDPAQLALLARSLGVMYAEYRDPNGMRSMDHTTSVLIVDPQARAVAALPAPHQPATMLHQWLQLRDHLGR